MYFMLKKLGLSPYICSKMIDFQSYVEFFKEIMI